jgi:hypothetical protein
MHTRFALALLIALVIAGGPAHAASIIYAATPLGGASWRYDYLVANDSLAQTIDEITVYFDVGLHENLAVAESPAGWDSLVVQPDAGLPDDGFLDALALDAGIAPGGFLGGFAVTFTWLGTGEPGAQLFEVVDPNEFTVIEAGMTAPVPLPGAAALLGTAMLLAVTRRRPRARGSGPP